MASDVRLKEQLPRLTEAIVRTYVATDRINHLGHCPLPKYEVILEILEDLTDILYPGFRRREGLHSGNVCYHVGDLVDRLHDRLTTQIARALRHADRRQPERRQPERRQTERAVNPSNPAGATARGIENHPCDSEKDYEAQGQQIAIAFLERIPELRAMLAKDVEAAFEGDPSVTNRDEIIFCFPGLEAVTIYRIAHELHHFGVPFIPRMMTEWAHKQTGIDIHPGAKIGEFFFIDHGTGVVIGETCEIGDRVKIYQGVTLGALSFATDADGQLIRGAKRHPTIEDQVVIYANATILGGRTIVGHDSVIGSSVWVTSSVAPHSTVVLEKPKLRIRNTTEELLAELNYQI